MVIRKVPWHASVLVETEETQLSIHVDREFTLRALTDLVKTNSVNPSLVNGAPGEAQIAECMGGLCKKIGLEIHQHESVPGRISVVGIRKGTGSGKSLMLNAHYDTVGVEGMNDPFAAKIRDGKMWGRGTYDMKGALAACLGAAKSLADADIELSGDLLIAAVADEEHSSLGMNDVIAAHHVNGAIVTEPTQLEICLAHKGFIWIEFVTQGRAAHGSQYQQGIDANMHMGRVLRELDRLRASYVSSPGHPLVGPPSLHAAIIEGGTSESMYASQCRLVVERRTIPGESKAQVIGEMVQIIERLKAEDENFNATFRLTLARDPFEISPYAGIVQSLRGACQTVLGRVPAQVGENPWMDSALLSAAGVETVVIGPAGGGAHSLEEWVELDSVTALAEVLARTAIDYCGISN